MFKKLRKVVGKVMNVTYKSLEKVFTNEKIKNDLFTFLVGGCGLSLVKSSNTKNDKISLGIAITGIGMSIILSSLLKEGEDSCSKN